MSKGLIINGRIISPGLELEGGSLCVEEGRIARIHAAGEPLPDLPVLLDAEGSLVVPGFIDIHTHGAAGHDVSHGRPESLREMARAKLAEGVTTFLPTTLSLERSALRRAFEAARSYMGDQIHARTPGFHAEGPFLNPEYAGVQNANEMRPPDMEELEELHDLVPIRLVSLAAELPGGIELVRELSRRNITSSLAHTAATHAQFRRALEAGATHLTHFCNQMTGLHHREIGLVGAGMLEERVMCEIICDGHHLCPEMVRLAWKTIGPRRLMLVTDSNAASHLEGDREMDMGGIRVVVRDGAARKAGTHILAGSVLRMNEGLRNLARWTGEPMERLLRTTALNQAESLGLGRFGRIEVGCQADLTVMDEDCSVRTVFVDGRRHDIPQG